MFTGGVLDVRILLYVIVIDNGKRKNVELECSIYMRQVIKET